jgi:hypothetical protein
MYQEISLRLSDGSEQKFPFLATGTTAYRFKQVFHQDLMILLNKMENSEDDQTDMTVGDKLAFIMNAQAEKKDMNSSERRCLSLPGQTSSMAQNSSFTCRSSLLSILAPEGQPQSQKKKSPN